MLPILRVYMFKSGVNFTFNDDVLNLLPSAFAVEVMFSSRVRVYLFGL